MHYEELINNLGKKRGHFKHKPNRIAKLVDEWPSLESKMVAMIERGNGVSDTARLAYATLLMMETGIRVGNEGSAEGFICKNQKVAGKDYPEKGIKKGDIIWEHEMNGKLVKTYGLTTLLGEHVKKGKNKLTIRFVGKKIVDQELKVTHDVLIRYAPFARMDKLWLDIKYHDVKKFVKRYVGRQYTPKDLRMAKVNLIFTDLFSHPRYAREWKQATSKSARNKILGACIEETATIIGHTKAVCKSAYLSKALIAYIIATPMPEKVRK